MQINGHLSGVIIETFRYILLIQCIFHVKTLKRRELRRFLREPQLTTFYIHIYFTHLPLPLHLHLHRVHLFPYKKECHFWHSHKSYVYTLICSEKPLSLAWLRRLQDGFCSTNPHIFACQLRRERLTYRMV